MTDGDEKKFTVEYRKTILNLLGEDTDIVEGLLTFGLDVFVFRCGTIDDVGEIAVRGNSGLYKKSKDPKN